MYRFRLKKKNSFIKLNILFLFFLIFIKVDYRISEPNIYGVSDDNSYYYHSSTIAKDFDLDYSNQVFQEKNLGQFLNIQNNIYVPRHPIGAGVLSSPIHGIGIFVEKLFQLNGFSYFIYSLSSIIYGIATYLLLSKILKNELTNKFKILFFSFFGSGLLYYATERFSMTPVYETFGSTILLWLPYKIFNSKSKSHINKYIFAVGLLSFLFLSIRWTNYFYFLIPLLYFEMNNNRDLFKKYFLVNIYYYLGLFFGLTIFLIHTKILYGFYTLNPGKIYSSSSTIVKIESMFEGSSDFGILNFLNINLVNYFKILFTQEFGLLYISPVLFFLLTLPIFLFFKKNYFRFILIFFIILIPLGTVLAWQTTASSYGFRYLFSLIPLGIFVYFKAFENRFISNYLIIFGIFSILSTLFFETNELTILSEQINSFNVLHKYSAPKFVYGVLISFLEITSYLKIFFTSYLGVLFFKLLNILHLENLFFDFVESAGFNHPGIELIYQYSNDFHWTNFILFLLIFILFLKKTSEYSFKKN